MNIAHSRLHKAYHYFRKIAIALRKNISNAQEISVLSLNGGRCGEQMGSSTKSRRRGLRRQKSAGVFEQHPAVLGQENGGFFDA